MNRGLGLGNYESQLRTERALANGPIVLTQAKFNIISGNEQLVYVSTRIAVIEGGFVVGGEVSPAVRVVGRFALGVGRWIRANPRKFGGLCMLCLGMFSRDPEGILTPQAPSRYGPSWEVVEKSEKQEALSTAIKSRSLNQWKP